MAFSLFSIVHEHAFKWRQRCHKLFFSYVVGEEYIKSLIGNPELVDRLALSNDDKVKPSVLYTYRNKSYFGMHDFYLYLLFTPLPFRCDFHLALLCFSFPS